MPKSKVRKKRTQPRASSGYAYEPPGRRGPTRFADFDDWMAARWTVRWTGIALLVAVGIAVAFGVALNATEREQGAFANAVDCSATASADCTLEYQASVKDKGSTGGKNPSYYLDLYEDDGPVNGRFYLFNEDALWDGASLGDTVTAIEWHGSVVRIVDGRLVGDTDLAPGVENSQVTAMFATSVFWALAVAVFFLRMLQLDFGLLRGWSKVLVPVCAVALLDMLFFPMGAMAGSLEESPLGVVVGGLVGSVVGALFVTWYWLRNR